MITIKIIHIYISNNSMNKLSLRGIQMKQEHKGVNYNMRVSKLILTKLSCLCFVRVSIGE